MRIEKCIFFARIRQFFCHENKLIIEKGPEKAFIPNIERLRISVEKEQSFKDIHHASACNFGDAIARMCSTGDAQALVVLFCFVLPFILLYLIILWCYNLNGLKILQNIFNSDHGLVFFPEGVVKMGDDMSGWRNRCNFLVIIAYMGKDDWSAH